MLHACCSDQRSLKFLALVPSKTIYAKQIYTPFIATHPIIIPLKLNGVSSYFDVRKLTWEEYEDQNILKVDCTVKAPP